MTSDVMAQTPVAAPSSAGCWQQLVEGMPEAVVVLNDRGRVIYHNPACLTLLQLAADDLPNCDFYALFEAGQPGDAARLTQALQTCLDGRQGEGIPHTVRLLAGKAAGSTCELRLMPLVMENGTRGAGLLLKPAVGLDDTFKIGLDAHLKWFRQSGNASCISLWHWPKSQQEASRFLAERMTESGRLLDVDFEQEWQGTILPYHRDKRHQMISAALEQCEPFQIEYSLTRPDGTERTVLDTGLPRFDAEGNCEGYIGAVIDISAYRNNKQLTQHSLRRLEASEDRFWKLLNANLLGIVLWRNNAVYEANEAFLNMLGYTRKDMDAGLLHRDAITPSEFKAQDEEMMALRHAQGMTPPYEKQYFHKNGHRIDVMVAAAVTNEDNSDDEGIAYVLDITRRKQAEQALMRSEIHLQELNDQLRRNNDELKHFVYVVSHDLLEPVRKVMSFSQRLKRGAKGGIDPWIEEKLGRIEASAERMHALIQALLSYSRLTTQAKPLEAVSTAQILADVMADLELSIAENQASIILPEEPPTLMADPVQLRQLFQNLMANAIKFRQLGQKPTVHIGSRLIPRDRLPAELGERVTKLPTPLAKTYAWLTVADNGIGFDEAHADSIFGIFQRLHPKHKYDGTGIGLSICKKIVDRHGGLIWASSVPDEGTTFHLLLPQI